MHFLTRENNPYFKYSYHNFCSIVLSICPFHYPKPLLVSKYLKFYLPLSTMELKQSSLVVSPLLSETKSIMNKIIMVSILLWNKIIKIPTTHHSMACYVKKKPVETIYTGCTGTLWWVQNILSLNWISTFP